MFYLIAALLLYTVAILIFSIANKNLNSTLVTAIINSISAMIPIGIIFSAYDKKIFENAKFGIIISIIGGIVIGLYTLMLSKSFAANKVGIVTPIIFGGAIFLSTILSAIIFKEKISMLQGVGLGFLGIGFLIIIYVKATATN